ncbi:hypothetical protein GGR52DRAFT_88729 [Hypoxylon sp. FL1284]|nr:hypothetical protein GGR52DRAFT_88729 [Hypoxylon sp. FL1284]
MMQSQWGANMAHIPPQTYTSDLTFDEISRQFALSDTTRRIPHGSTGQRTPGSMRIVKPSSASNSPQAVMARRRTMMNDNIIARRRQAYLQQHLQDCMSYWTAEDSVERNTRPVSWHPTSHYQQSHTHMPVSQPDYSQYVVPTPMQYQTDMYSGYQNLSPTPAVYSAQTSPMATASPLCLPYSACSQPRAAPEYMMPNTWDQTPQSVPSTYSTSAGSAELEPFPSFEDQASFSWDGGVANGFDSCTAPPTPDEFQPAQQPQPMVPSEESIPYEPLEEQEEEGEVLVGMGLYDLPKADTDPELDNYRTTTSQLLGSTYREKGRGWKLEEAWEPPASDDDEDGEGDEEEEEEEAETDQAAQSNSPQETWI